MSSNEFRITDEVDTFIATLRAGDVLLFDTMSPLSNLVKLAENRPVNHCALYLGDGEIAHVGRHTGDPQGGGPPFRPAARTGRLADKVAAHPGRYDRTVTALRHKDLANSSEASAVVERALNYVDPQNTTYNYVSLIGLMVPSLLRTYRLYFKDDGVSGLMVNSLRAVAQSFVEVLQKDLAGSPTRGRTLTCSEFIYRCFDETKTELRLEVSDPLARWPDPANLRSPAHTMARARSTERTRSGSETSGPIGARSGDEPQVTARRARGGGTHSVVDGVGLVVFDDSFRADFLGPVDTSPGTADMGTTGIDTVPPSRRAIPKMDIAVLIGKTIIDLIWNNRNLGKYDGAVAGADEGDVFPDLVTPRDLWSSPSLRTAAVLHRPPGTNDGDLDHPPRVTQLFED